MITPAERLLVEALRDARKVLNPGAGFIDRKEWTRVYDRLNEVLADYDREDIRAYAGPLRRAQ